MAQYAAQRTRCARSLTVCNWLPLQQTTKNATGVVRVEGRLWSGSLTVSSWPIASIGSTGEIDPEPTLGFLRSRRSQLGCYLPKYCAKKVPAAPTIAPMKPETTANSTSSFFRALPALRGGRCQGPQRPSEEHDIPPGLVPRAGKANHGPAFIGSKNVGTKSPPMTTMVV